MPVAQAEPSVDEAANQAIVQRFYDEVFTGKDMSVLAEVFDADMVLHNLDFTPQPEGVLVQTLAAFPDVAATVNLWVLKDDLVTAYVTYNGTHQAEFLGAKPTGKAVTWSMIDIFRVKDGKVVELWHDIPNEDVLDQIGGSGGSKATDEADLIRATELERLRAMVDADMETADRLHADNFQIIPPFGATMSREQFLGDVESGLVDFLVWEPATEIEVRQIGDMAVIRYKSFTVHRRLRQS
ncbi:MAG: SnoaL-like domain-containing protein [Caldilineaceae bacterium]|nr:SnoaL-like domain-containing protein [Caldilineaceae bacterium]